MKKIIFNVTLISIVTFFILLTSCNNTSTDIRQSGFVYIEDNTFMLNEEVFFPLMINYKVDVRKLGDDVVISPALYYDNNYIFESNTKDEVLKQFSTHLELMKELGFNSIRICVDVIKNEGQGHFFLAGNEKIYLRDHADKIVDAINDALSLVASHDMKAMLLLKPPFEEEVKEFNIKIFKRFADNTTIFAYDFMNEPLYFDIVQDRSKNEAVKIVSQWKKLIDRYSPNHLFTIGFAEPIEVFEWDPSMLPVDFVQIHTYHPLRIPNEIWWYSNYIGKPWMIGETSLPADNDSISYEQQALFVEEAYQHTIDCGGIGFGWWEFQDHINAEMNFEANYSGFLNHQGVTMTKSGNEIMGSLKPVAYKFAKLHEMQAKKTVRPVNYFNMLGYENYVIKGKIICDDKAVEGAVIRGWTQYWKIGMNTFSDENGDFTLYSNDSCVYFEVSAPGMTNVKFNSNNLNIKYQRVDGKDHDFSDLENIDLEYHKITYDPFIKNDSTLLDFKEDMFNKKKFEAEIGCIELRTKNTELRTQN